MSEEDSSRRWSVSNRLSQLVAVHTCGYNDRLGIVSSERRHGVCVERGVSMRMADLISLSDGRLRPISASGRRKWIDAQHVQDRKANYTYDMNNGIVCLKMELESKSW
jgi:hypothetical protein